MRRPAGNDERGGRGDEPERGPERVLASEGIARTVHEDRRCPERREMRGAEPLRPFRRVQGIREEQERVGGFRGLGREHGGLPAAIGVAAEHQATRGLPTQCRRRAPEPGAVVLGSGGAGRAGGPLLAKGQVAAEHGEPRRREGRRHFHQGGGLRVPARAVREHETVLAGPGGVV